MWEKTLILFLSLIVGFLAFGYYQEVSHEQSQHALQGEVSTQPTVKTSTEPLRFGYSRFAKVGKPGEVMFSVTAYRGNNVVGTEVWKITEGSNATRSLLEHSALCGDISLTLTPIELQANKEILLTSALSGNPTTVTYTGFSEESFHFAE